MSELEEFRSKWEKELSHTRRRSEPEPNDVASGSISSANQLDEEIEIEDVKIVQQTSHDENLVLHDLFANDSNSTEKYHPFVIVDNLLKNTCNSKRDTANSPKETTRPNYFSNDSIERSSGDTRSTEAGFKPVSGRKRDLSTPQTYARLQTEKKRRLLKDKQERLLDKLISDLDEITEIPFFDIDLPRELGLKIFQHLQLTDLCRCSQVSKAWKNLAEDELLWYRVCVDLGEHKNVTEGVNWKSHARYCVTRAQDLVANWKSRVGSLHQLQYIKGGIVLCHVHSHENRIVAGYSNGQVKMWELTSGEECVFQPSSTSLTIDEGQEEGTLPNLLVSVSTSENYTIAAYSQGIVDVWQNAGVATSSIYTITCPERISCCTLSPDEPLLLTAFGAYVRTDFAQTPGNFQQLQILDLNKKVRFLALYKCPEAFQNVVYKAVICTDNIIWIHRPGDAPDTMTEIHNVIDAPITAIDVASQISQLAVGVSIYGAPSNPCKVKLYAVDSGKLMSTLKGHTHYISCINLRQSPVNHLVTGCGDRKVRVYDVRVHSPVMTLAAHTQTVTQVQMDDWKVVSGGGDGVTCVWDQRMTMKLWDWHNRHPVRYCQFEDNLLRVANIPDEKFPQTEEFESVLHKRYRGSIQIYDFLSDQNRQGLPENCLSSYDTAEGYDYNIRLTVPYDNV